MNRNTKTIFKINHRNFLASKFLSFLLWILIWSCCCTSVTKGGYRCTLKDFIRLGSSCYFVSADIASWQEAHFRCRDRGAQLAVLSSPYEDSTLRSYLQRREFAQLYRWIGGMWAGKWIWAAKGSVIESKHNFVNEEAFNLRDNDQWMCLYMDPMNWYRWNNENCIKRFHYICEAPLTKENGKIYMYSHTRGPIAVWIESKRNTTTAPLP